MSLLSVDPYLLRTYVQGQYDCLDMAGDVWFDLTGEDLRDRLQSLMGRGKSPEVSREHVRAFTRLDAPQDPCLVLMRRPRSPPHAGVYVRGRVLHLHPGGAEYQPVDVAARCFTSVRFYR